MRKHPLVKDMRKLNFHLVPVSGVAKRNGGDKKFRAEFVRGNDEGDNRGVLGVDRVLAEAIEAHHLNGISPDMLKLYVESVLQTMIDKTVEDGRTRRFDDYLSVSLKIHGGFVCHVRRERNVVETLDVEVKERTENEILCKWPEGLGEDQMRRSVEFAVVKLNEDFWSDEKAEDKYRYLRASILPE